MAIDKNYSHFLTLTLSPQEDKKEPEEKKTRKKKKEKKNQLTITIPAFSCISCSLLSTRTTTGEVQAKSKGEKAVCGGRRLALRYDNHADNSSTTTIASSSSTTSHTTCGTPPPHIVPQDHHPQFFRQGLQGLRPRFLRRPPRINRRLGQHGPSDYLRGRRRTLASKRAHANANPPLPAPPRNRAVLRLAIPQLEIPPFRFFFL